MEFEKMTIEDMKKVLDEKGIDHSGAKKRDEYIELLKNELEEDSATEAEPEEVEEKPKSVVGAIQSAMKIEKTVTKKADDPTAYLAGRDYSQLTAGERTIVRQRSPEYENKESGVQVKVTDLLTNKHQIAKTANLKWRRFLKGQNYVLSQEDYEALKGVVVKVKISGTCCGNAVYESVPLLEVVND